MAAWPIRFSSGAKPGKKRPLPKQGADENTKLFKRSLYEKEKRPDRTFNPKWKDNHPWLLFENNVMKYGVCIEFANQVPNNLKHKHLFLTGCTNFKLSTILDHERSKGHTDAVVKQVAKSNPTKTTAHKTLLSLNEKNKKQLELKFRNMHAVIKQNRPISDYMWLNQLDIAKGFDDGSVNTYNNRFSGTLFLENIASIEQDNLHKLVSTIKFFSLTMDGSTDDSVTEQETLFVRTSHHGEITTRFMCIGEPESTSSADLYAFVINQMKSNKIYMHMGKLVGFGSDGASNMTGVKNGLVALLKRELPDLVGIHCLGHRLELAFKDALKKDKTHDKLVTLLLGIFYFYKNSPKQRKALKDTFKVMSIKGQLPHRVGGSRWMPHMKKALNSVFTSYPAYITHLQTMSHSNAKAEGLAKLLGNFDILAYAALMFDLLEPLTRLSLALQRQDVTLGDVHLNVLSTVDVLEQCLTRKSDRLSSILETKMYSGYTLSGRRMCSLHLETCVKAITDAISIRFKDLNEDLLPTIIASFRNWPTEPSADFGDDHVASLVARFKDVLERQDVATSEMLTEWRLLKSLVYHRFKDSVKKLKWPDVHSMCSSVGVDNILALMDLVNSFPPTSVLNETAFNQMKLAKSDRRHRLTNKHLNDCMLVRLEAANILDFDPTAAIEKWMLAPSGQRRRMHYKRTQPNVSSTQPNDSRIVIHEDEDTTEVIAETHPSVSAQSDDSAAGNADTETSPLNVEHHEQSQDNSSQESNSDNISDIAYDTLHETVAEVYTQTVPQQVSAVTCSNTNDSDSDYESDFEFEQNEATNTFLISKYSSEELYINKDV